jgi:hypothetical protein
MARITLAQAQGWAELTKLELPALDLALLNQLESEILARLGSAVAISTWIDDTTTPELVQTIIAKTYVSWAYNRQYSENQSESNDYANLLLQNAEMLITGIVEGTIEIPNVPGIGSGTPAFYPNDASSAMEPTADDMSLGPAKFSMGKVF